MPELGREAEMATQEDPTGIEGSEAREAASQNGYERIAPVGLIETVQGYMKDEVYTPEWVLPVLEKITDPDITTYQLHQLRSAVRLVSVIMKRTGPEDIKVWIGEEEQLPEWARKGLQRFLLTGQGFERNRLVSEVTTLDILLTARLGFDDGDE